MKTLLQIITECGADVEGFGVVEGVLPDVDKLVTNYLERTKHYTEVQQGYVAVLFLYELISRLEGHKQLIALKRLQDTMDSCAAILVKQQLQEGVFVIKLGGADVP